MCDDWDLACPPREIVWKRSPRENDNEDTIIWRDYSPPPLWGANKTTEPGFCAPEDAVGPGYSGARNHARKRGIPEQHLQNSTRARLSRKLEAWGDTRRVEARGHRDEGPLGEAPRSYSWNDDEISHFSNTSLVHVRIPFEDTVLHSESEEEEEVSDTECPVASFTALKRATAFPPQESSEELEDTTKWKACNMRTLNCEGNYANYRLSIITMHRISRSCSISEYWWISLIDDNKKYLLSSYAK
eukprot:GEMP01069206.1.p1 GENE.GEMP01069206.1~~GEMP01069206.1.p1  ORF type:complete len:244 (+),score=47.94 GEMP01069206.1:60-791(+)